MNWRFPGSAGSTIDGGAWRVVLAAIPCHDHLDAIRLDDWRRLAQRLLRRKRIVPAEDFELEHDERILIAALAALPVLELGLDWYRGWTEILIYPGAFRRQCEYEDDAGVVHTSRRTLSGEAWLRGPLILSWDDVVADLEDPGVGSNVVIHECAHKLDMLRGGVDNGFPPLHAQMDPIEWSAILSAAYSDLRERLERALAVAIDPYAAESPGEFFAVLSEHFFVSPRLLDDAYPAVYRQLRAFYRQDPLSSRGKP